MWTWIKIAFRNLGKNRRRSLFTIFAIGLGLAAVNVFGGFTDYIFTSLRDTHIYVLSKGHLAIFKQGFLTAGKLDPKRYLLNESEIHQITEILQNFPEVDIVTPQLRISGLLSNGDVSTIFIGLGHIPSDTRRIRNYARGGLGDIKLFQGEPLRDGLSYGAGLSTGLAALLELKLNDNAIALATTTEGQLNALDLQVLQTFDAQERELNDKLLAVPFEFAQELYDTRGADRLTVLLQHTSQTETMKATLQRALADHNLPVEIRTWNELSQLYTRIKQMFDVIFLFLFVIVFVIVIMSVINTISMAVIERTQEIGTLRALGVKRPGIIMLFGAESILLGAIGSALGIALTLLGWLAIQVFEPTWTPPIVTQRIPLEFDIVLAYIVTSVICLILLSLVASVFPVRRAVNRPIVDALGHV